VIPREDEHRKVKGEDMPVDDVHRAQVGLSDALIALRGELLQAWQEGEESDRRLRFRLPEPIELTLQVAATQEGKGSAGIKWWLVSVGGEASRGSTLTQTLSLKLAPVMYDDNGKRVESVEIDRAL